MNLTAIKRVVDVTETQTDSNIFALVCRTNQELKERMFVFQIVSEDVDKKSFLRNLCRNVASTMCRPDPDTYLRVMRAEDLGLEPSDFSISNFSTIGRSFQKKVRRSMQFLTRSINRNVLENTSSANSKSYCLSLIMKLCEIFLFKNMMLSTFK